METTQVSDVEMQNETIDKLKKEAYCYKSMMKAAAHELRKYTDRDAAFNTLLNYLDDGVPAQYLQGQFNLISFAQVLQYLKEGKLVQRNRWNGSNNLFIFCKPNDKKEYRPRMWVPEMAKEILIERASYYSDKILIANSDGSINDWTPTSSDLFSEDWIILE